MPRLYVEQSFESKSVWFPYCSEFQFKRGFRLVLIISKAFIDNTALPEQRLYPYPTAIVLNLLLH